MTGAAVVGGCDGDDRVGQPLGEVAAEPAVGADDHGAGTGAAGEQGIVLGGPVVIEAVTAAGEVLERVDLAHGLDPVLALARRGRRLEQVLGARREGDTLVVQVLVSPAAPADHADEAAPQRRPAELVVDPDESVRRVQRVAAYAYVVSERGLLATEYSARVAVSGRWGLPGGGLDEGEDPQVGLVRECREETAQHVVVGRLAHLETEHWIGRAPHGGFEDFHAVRLLYAATCPEPGEPRVEEIDGTTSAARWVPLPEVGAVSWSASAARQLRRFGVIDARGPA